MPRQCVKPSRFLFEWNEQGNGTPAVRDLNRLAGLNEPQMFAGILSKFSDADRLHVLHVARYPGLVQRGQSMAP